MLRPSRVRSHWLALAVVGAAALGCCQTTGRVAGTIKDQTGAVIASADVRAVGALSGGERKAVTDRFGQYVVPVLQPGIYRLSISATGFQAKTIEEVRVNVTETTTVDVSLQVGTAKDAIIVT